jgi:hypothetical protein
VRRSGAQPPAALKDRPARCCHVRDRAVTACGTAGIPLDGSQIEGSYSNQCRRHHSEPGETHPASLEWPLVVRASAIHAYTKTFIASR